jgi:hypothetical protein
MAMFQEGRGLASEAEPLGLLTEGAAGIAVICPRGYCSRGDLVRGSGIYRDNRRRRPTDGSGIQ